MVSLHETHRKPQVYIYFGKRVVMFMIKKEKDGIVYFEFEHFNKTGLVNHCFSTRIGGRSVAPYDSMNLAYHMGDAPDVVDQNFALMSAAVGFDADKIVMTDQIHENYHHVVYDDTKPEWVDGLITEVPGYTLASYYADCVPLLFLDPKAKVIANAHAGWRGTSFDMAGKTIQELYYEFGCEYKDILVGIGPAISGEHYEVGTDVVEQLLEYLPSADAHITAVSEGKWHVDLVAINYHSMLSMGIPAENIEVANLCTYSNPELFFSHRRDGRERGNMAAMIMLRSEG